MAEFSYKGDLSGGSLLVRESRIIADLLLNNASAQHWAQAIQVDNLLQKRSPATAKRYAHTIRKRLALLGPDYWRVLRDGDDELATQVAFYATLERNRLLVHFIETQVRDAYVTQAKQLQPYQWLEFLEESAQLDPAIATWQIATKKKMGQAVFRMLAEAGYLQRSRHLTLQHVQLRPELKTLLDNNDKKRLKKCMEVSLKAN